MAGGLTEIPFAPYCGAPPGPATLWTRWNLDPVLLVALLAAVLAWGLLSRSVATVDRTGGRWRGACFLGGWAIGALALVSPLCALSVSLFSARVGQHMALETVAAPLMALGLPALKTFGPPRPLMAAAVFAVMLWFWHAPGPYAETFRSTWVYWLMHISAFGAALWLWNEVLRDPGRRLGARLAAALITTVQMGLLGSLFTFAGRPMFAVHAATTAAWGLTPLEDQQLGGVIMWVPAGAVLLVAIVGAVGLAMRGSKPGDLAAARP